MQEFGTDLMDDFPDEFPEGPEGAGILTPSPELDEFDQLVAGKGDPFVLSGIDVECSGQGTTNSSTEDSRAKTETPGDLTNPLADLETPR